MNNHSVRRGVYRRPDDLSSNSGPSPTIPPRAGTDKRGAILGAATRLIARLGLHNTPMSALAREAGVATGTLYLYFPSKEAMINALYLELHRDREVTIAAASQSDEPTPEVSHPELWRPWHALARWHLDNPEASSVLHQCQASGILTAETRAIEEREQAERFPRFEDIVASGKLRDMPRQVFWALFAGPVLVLAQLRDAGELEVTDEVLRATYEGVCRSVMPADDPYTS
jgi:AcrR family transcriptional regulator